MKPHEKQWDKWRKRRAEVVKACKTKTQAQVARDFGISRQRVAAIVAEQQKAGANGTPER